MRLEDLGHEVWAPRDDDDVIRSGLRFAPGAAVECRLEQHAPGGAAGAGGGGWVRGEVVAIFHREPSWPEGRWAPYQVRLESGRTVHAPADADDVIRGV